jgi:hypothetical protein
VSLNTVTKLRFLYKMEFFGSLSNC